jgi:hypothetical protein
MNAHEKTARELYQPAMRYLWNCGEAQSPDCRRLREAFVRQDWKRVTALCVYWLQRRTQAENNGVKLVS